MRLEEDAGHHAGDHAWAVYKDGPTYCCGLFKIKTAIRDGDEVFYEFAECGFLPSKKVFARQSDAEKAIARRSRRCSSKHGASDKVS